MTSWEHIWKPHRLWADFFRGGRPTVVLVPPLCASVSIRLLPPSSVSVRLWSLLVCVSDGDMSAGHDDVGEHIWGPTGHAPNFRQKSTESSSDTSSFLIPSASASLLFPPSSVGSRSGPHLSLWGRKTCLWAFSADHIWIRNMPRVKLSEGRPIPSAFRPFPRFHRRAKILYQL